jgi:hypothetical protein
MRRSGLGKVVLLILVAFTLFPGCETPSPGGWLQVRDTRTNIIGWSYGRYLESFPVRYPRLTPRKRGSSRKGAPKSREAPQPTPKPM